MVGDLIKMVFVQDCLFFAERTLDNWMHTGERQYLALSDGGPCHCVLYLFCNEIWTCIKSAVGKDEKDSVARIPGMRMSIIVKVRV